MKKILFFTFFLVLGWVMAPTHGISALIYYDAYGSIDDKHGNPLQISGGMYIENQLWSVGGRPVDTTDDLFYGAFDYFVLPIELFNLKVDEYKFYGSGLFEIGLQKHFSGDVSFGYSFWYLYGSKLSQWSLWQHGLSSANPININHKFSLADEIFFDPFFNLVDHDCPILGGIGGYRGGLNLTLVRQDSIPVPEPSTGILFGIGIAGLFIYRLRGSPSST